MAASLTAKQIRDGEGLHTEFKAGVRTLDTIARSVCAFLNTLGGTIFCGIADDGSVVGIQDAEAERAWLEPRLQAAITPRALFTISVELIHGKPVVVIEVPEGKDRPYVHAGAVFVREQSISRAADARMLRTLVQGEATQLDRWERRPSLALEFDDLDSAEIETTVEEAGASGRFSFAEPGNRRAVLSALGMLTPTGLTNGADVAFAREPSRRHPQCRIRVLRFESDKGGDAYLDDRWFEGPLVRAFESAFEALSGQVRIQSYFPAGQVRREDRPQYASEALREGLVNAVAHRDYAAFSGGVTISIYPGRIEIWNSGRLPSELRPQDLRKVHPSIPTNPDISHILYLRRLMERIGRGTEKIVSASKELGAQPPRWTDRPSGVTLTIFAAQGAKGLALELNSRQLRLLRDLNLGEQVSANDYAQSVATEVSDRQARRDLSQLEEAGLLIRHGAARSTHYERTDQEL